MILFSHFSKTHLVLCYNATQHECNELPHFVSQDFHVVSICNILYCKRNINPVAAIICKELLGNHYKAAPAVVSAIRSFFKHLPQAEFEKTILVKWKQHMCSNVSPVRTAV